MPYIQVLQTDKNFAFLPMQINLVQEASGFKYIFNFLKAKK